MLFERKVENICKRILEVTDNGYIANIENLRDKMNGKSWLGRLFKGSREDAYRA